MLIDASVHTILNQIESLLNDGDIAKASALIKEYRNEISLTNKRFQKLLVVLYSKRIKQSENIDQTHNQTLHFGNTGLIGNLLDKIQKCRESGDYMNARDLCREWLKIEPDSQRAKEIYDAVESAISLDREHLSTLNRSKYFIELNRFQDALNLLETIPKESAYSSAARELLSDMDIAIRKEDVFLEEKKVLDEVSRLLEMGHLDLASAVLNRYPSYSSNEIRVLRVKTERAIEKRKTEKELTEKLWISIEDSDLEQAMVWLGMIAELNPSSSIHNELQRRLEPDIYENLTRGFTIT